MPRPTPRLLCTAVAAVFFASAYAPAVAGTHDNNRGFANTADSIIDLLTSPAAPKSTHRSVPQRSAAKPKPRPQVAAKPKPRPMIAAKPKPKPRPMIAAKPQPRPMVAAKTQPRPMVAAKPQPRPMVAAKPQPRPMIAARPKPRPMLAARPKPQVMSQAQSRLQIGLAQFVQKPQPQHRRASQQIAHLQTLPALLATMQKMPVKSKKPLSSSILPPQHKIAASVPAVDKAVPKAKSGADAVIVADVVKPSGTRVVAMNVVTKPHARARAKHRKAKAKAFKPSRGGHGIAIVRPWQGSIPDEYCDLPTGCATAAPAAAAAPAAPPAPAAPAR